MGPLYDDLQDMAYAEHSTHPVELVYQLGERGRSGDWPADEAATAREILDRICLHHGRRLPTDVWSAFRYSWMLDVSDAMRAAGHDSDLLHLSTDGPPPPFPEDTEPGTIIGWWSPEAAGRWLAGLTGRPLPAPAKDAALAEVVRWMTESVRTQTDLVTFCR